MNIKIKRSLTIIILVILIVTTTVILCMKLNSNYLNRLSASISQTNEDGSLWMDCNTEIDVNESITCSIKAQINGKTIQAFQGRLEYSSNLQISEIRKSNIFSTGEDNNVDMMYFISDTAQGANGDVTLATFKVKGLSAGTSEIRLTNIDNDNAKMYLTLYDGTEVKQSVFDTVTRDITVNALVPELSTDATLKSLKVDNQDVLSSLEKTVLSETTSVNITAEANEEHATITGTGTKTISTGVNTFIVTVLAQDQITTKSYTIDIIRQRPAEKSSINTLSSLVVAKNGEFVAITPEFSSEVTDYACTVPYDTSNVNINVTRTDDKSSVAGDGEKTLRVGTNVFEVVVTAENNDTNTYTVTVIREDKIDDKKSSDNTLSSLNVTNATLTPEFNSEITEYTATVLPEVNKVKIEATANNDKATIKEEDLGEKNLEYGSNVFTVTVTAEDNSVKLYTVNVTREKSGGAQTCTLSITSSVYTIDEVNSAITIPLEDNSEKIISNIKSTADVSISDDRIIVKCSDQIKEYKINRYWAANTGQNVVKYTAVIIGLLIIIGALFIIKMKQNK